MKHLLCIFLLIAATTTANAQLARDSVIAAVNLLFTGMKNADTGMIKKSFSSNAVLQSIQDDKGIIIVTDEKIADFIEFVSKETVGAADERIVVENVLIDGPMATVWAPYKFYYKGKFSHCGVDAFQLVRQNGVWRIQYIIDTRRKDNCL